MYYRRGYIAVISAIIITAILIVVALIFSNSIFLGRFDTLGFEARDTARKIAESCLEHAKLQLAQGSYGGSETINVGGETCDILPIETLGNEKVIKTKAEIFDRVVNLKLTVNGSTLESISLEEVGSF